MKSKNRRADFFNREFESKMKMRKSVKNFFVLAALVFAARNYVAFAEDLHDKLPDNFLEVKIISPEEEMRYEINFSISSILFEERNAIRERCAETKFVEYFGTICLNERKLFREPYSACKNFCSGEMYLVTLDSVSLPECKLAHIDGRETVNFDSERVYSGENFVDVRCWKIDPAEDKKFVWRVESENETYILEIE
ncbi:MAG: hypothetical protein K2I95_07370 [Treponemataceae bacterium]|nr:hypothetical protein [Treponemataceae bacterium]